MTQTAGVRDVPAAGGNPGEARPASAYVGLGSNLGDRLHVLRSVVTQIDRGDLAGCRLRRTSPIYETRPIGPTTVPFLNAAIELGVTATPSELMAGLLELERAHGRIRGGATTDRTLDLDLLLFIDADGREVRVDTTALTLPHPRLWERDFVLAPLADLLDGAPRLDGASALARLTALPPEARTVLRRLDEPLGPA